MCSASHLKAGHRQRHVGLGARASHHVLLHHLVLPIPGTGAILVQLYLGAVEVGRRQNLGVRHRLTGHNAGSPLDRGTLLSRSKVRASTSVVKSLRTAERNTLEAVSVSGHQALRLAVSQPKQDHDNEQQHTNRNSARREASDHGSRQVRHFAAGVI